MIQKYRAPSKIKFTMFCHPVKDYPAYKKKQKTQETTKKNGEKNELKPVKN